MASTDTVEQIACEAVESIRLNAANKKFNSWSFKVSNETVHIQTIRYSSDYLYIWLGSSARLDNLSLAVQTKYEKLPIGVKVCGNGDNDSQQFIDNLASKLSFKLKKQVLLSFNLDLNANPDFVLSVEKCLFKEINSNKEKF